MKTLYDRLKPQYKDVIYSHQEKYSTSINSLIETLKTKHTWFSLEVSDVSTFLTFTDVPLYNLTSSDVMFGSKFFTNE
tara:strand:+ start:442 stop:675 length:234 start_codon:yes stop_codon:yes gene_type:complete